MVPDDLELGSVFGMGLEIESGQALKMIAFGFLRGLSIGKATKSNPAPTLQQKLINFNAGRLFHKLITYKHLHSVVSMGRRFMVAK